MLAPCQTTRTCFTETSTTPAPPGGRQSPSPGSQTTRTSRRSSATSTQTGSSLRPVCTLDYEVIITNKHLVLRRPRSRPRSGPRRHFSGGSPPQISYPALSSSTSKQGSANANPPPIWPHMNSLVAGLARQYEKGSNFDVTIKCGGSQFGFYKIVLSAYSDVFQVGYEGNGIFLRFNLYF